MIVTFRDAGQRRVIRLRPVRVQAYWISGLLFLALGVVLAFTMCRATAVSCRPSSSGGAWCVIDRSGWSGGAREEGWLRSARVEPRTSLGFVGTEVVLLGLDGRQVELSLIAADGDDKASLVKRLETLLAGTSRDAAGYQEDTRALMGLLSLVLVVAGGVILWSIERVRVVIDRAAREIRITGRSGLVTRTHTIPFDIVRGIGRHSVSLEGATSHHVVIRTRGRGEITVARAPLFTEDSAARTIDLIEEARRSGVSS